MKKEVKVRYYFDDYEPSPEEVKKAWGRLAYLLLKIQEENKKEKDNGKCFNVSGRLRQKKEFC